MQEIKKEEAEEKARQFREKMKERRVVDDETPTTSGPILPQGKTEPYGQWKVIKEKPKIDLQLPAQQEYLEMPVFEETEVQLNKEFKEKVVEKIEGSETSFKKRKFGTATKRNVRQRLNDD